MTGDMLAWESPTKAGVDALRVVRVPVPTIGDDQILIRTEAAALNFSDLLMIDGTYQIRPDRPFTPGQEVAGTVTRAGAATDFTPGTRVAGKVLWGGFAEFAVLRGDMAFPVPDLIDPPTAAALPVVYTTAMVALTEDAGIQANHTILIHAAAGGIGSAAVQIARSCGAKVIAAVTGAHKCATMRAEGVDPVIDYSAGNLTEAVMAATEGRGADIILDSVGGEVTLASLRCIARHGQLLIVGFSSGQIPELPANRLLLRRAIVRGVYWDHDHDADMIARCTAKLIELCLDGKIRPIVNSDYGFADLPSALDDLRAGESIGKLVLDVRSGSDAKPAR